MTATRKIRACLVAIAVTANALMALRTPASAQSNSIYRATLAEPNQATAEVTTEELQRILADGSALVLDSRNYAQYAAGHIPGARLVTLRSGAPPSEIAAEVERLLNDDRTRALVLYCNGPFCQASRRLAEQLVAGGFTNVRRYQLGIPVWRALGGVTEIELEGIRRIYGVDGTAVFFDARAVEEFSAGSLGRAKNLPLRAVQADGIQKAAADLLPNEDFNTRIVVFGRDASQARALAEAIAQNARHNVAYFAGTIETLQTALQ